MKKIIFSFLTTIFCIIVYGQNPNDIVYLKNGSIIKGIVTEQVLGYYLKIMTTDGNILDYKNILIYQMDEVEKISKEESIANTNSTPPTNYQSVKPIFKKRSLYVEMNVAYTFSWLGGFNDATGFEGELRSSYQAGLSLNYAINKNFGLESGVEFLLFGGNKYSLSTDNYLTEGTIDLNYLQVPFFIKFDFLNSLNNIKGTSAGLKTGIQFGFNTLAKDWGDTKIYYPASTNYYSNKFDVNTNIDWIIGVFTYLGGSGVGMNFNLGLNDVVKTSLNKNFKNRSISFTYSYRF
jgi:hypothetical protein